MLKDLAKTVGDGGVNRELPVFASGAVIGRQFGGTEPEKLQFLVYSDDVEQPPGNRVVERFRQFEVHAF